MNEERDKPEDKDREPVGGSGGDGDEDVSMPEAVLEKAPKEIKETILAMAHMAGPLPNPLFKAIKPEHITKLIESSDSETKMVYTDAKEERSHKLIIFIITVVALIALVVFLVLTGEKDILQDLIYALLGFAGGYGVGRYIKD